MIDNKVVEENAKLKETLQTAKNLIEVQAATLEIFMEKGCTKCKALLGEEEPHADHTIDFKDIEKEYESTRK